MDRHERVACHLTNPCGRIARELAGRKVTCNAIAPGFITTDMTDELSDDLKAGIVAKVPLADFGQVNDIANTVLFLASPAARYITGQVLGIDGGGIKAL